MTRFTVPQSELSREATRMRSLLGRPVWIAMLAAGLSAGCRAGYPLPWASWRASDVRTVMPGVLLRGPQPDERALRQLRDKFGVRTIVNFNDLTNKPEAKEAERVGLNYLPLDDDP